MKKKLKKGYEFLIHILSIGIIGIILFPCIDSFAINAPHLTGGLGISMGGAIIIASLGIFFSEKIIRYINYIANKKIKENHHEK